MLYDPSSGPDTRQWLALTEEQRFTSVLEYHRHAKIDLPNARLHAAMHVIVENQLAEQYEPAVVALARLVTEGLSRHDAIHAIASVLTMQMHDLMQGSRQGFDQHAYERELTGLTAARWKRGLG